MTAQRWLAALRRTAGPRPAGLLLTFAVAGALLAGCGGSGAGRDGSPSTGTGGTGGTGGSGDVTQLANQCAPDNTLARTSTGALKPGYTAGSLDRERSWVRAMMTADYLWFSEIPAVDTTLPAYNVSPAEIALDNYFEALKTPAVTASGKEKDAFSFTLPTDEWEALSESGIVAGYGFELVVYAPRAPRDLRVAYTQPGSQAAAAGVLRGDRLVSVTTGGRTIDVVNTTISSEIDTLNATLFSPPNGTTVTLRLRNVAGLERDVSLVAGSVTTQPVLVSQVLTRPDSSRVGYLVFNDFVLPAEGQLQAVFQSFADQRIDDLVLDLRYNGGGYLYIASQLAYMIARNAATTGRTFERFVFSSKRSAESAQASNRYGFRSTTSGLAGTGTTPGGALPNLGLSRVYVLATPNTCSASESVVNGLRGVDIEVVLLGGASCGKPYGFTAKDNCGLSYFPVEFQGVNDKGFGDFADGFAPNCTVADDLSRALGDPNEGMLAAALLYRDGATCAALGVAAKGAGEPAGTSGLLPRSPGRSGKFAGGAF